MKLPLSWLKDYVDIGEVSPQELADKLLSIGFEVEEIITPREDIRGVLVGKVVSIVRHENSDKLWICQIDVGNETLQIVTGAQNVHAGDFVPVATVGAELPGGKKLAAAKLRGVESYGMLCSGSELCVDDDVIDGASVDGILILPKNSRVGENIMHTLGIDDTVLDVSITANRPDCQAIVNLAREISVLFDKKFKMPKLDFACQADGDLPNIIIENKKLCSRYIGRMITDVKIEKSPKWMRDRLRMCGIRPINNLVDITNYVLLEFGQPLHAFDRSYIKGSVHVRTGIAGEKITALDGKEYSVENALVIADDVKPLAIAGIMGGEYTSIFPDTQTVFLEAARFERSNIRRTSRKIGLRSDSSARYEKGVDWMTTELGSMRALALIEQLGCGKICETVVTDSVEPPVEKIIETTKDDICGLLGIDIDVKVIVNILKKQGIAVKKSGKKLLCTIPISREDIDGYPDLAEDIMRFYGYDKIVSTYSENTHQTCGKLSNVDANIESLKARLCACGADETMNYSFISPDACDKILLDSCDPWRNMIQIKNPLSRDISVMRTQLVSSMLDSISRNCSRKNSSMRFFEIGKVFIADKLPIESLPQERYAMCIGICNDGDFYTLKSIVCDAIGCICSDYTLARGAMRYLHPKQSMQVVHNGKAVGYFGKVHPLVCENYNLPSEVFVAHIDITDMLVSPITVKKAPHLPKLPPVDRDLAVVVKKDVAVGDMLRAAKSADTHVSDARLFDIYEGEQIDSGYKSVAFSVRLQPVEKTFSDVEIGNIVNAILTKIGDEYGAKLR